MSNDTFPGADLAATGYYDRPCECGYLPAPMYGSHTDQCVAEARAGLRAIAGV